MKKSEKNEAINEEKIKLNKDESEQVSIKKKVEKKEEKQSSKRKNRKVIEDKKTQENEKSEESKGIFNKFFRNKKK